MLNPSPYRYIKAGPEHTKVLVQLRLDFLEEYWGKQSEEQRRLLRTALEVYFEKALQNGSYVSFLAYQDEQLAGVGGMVYREQPGGFKNPSGKMAYLMNMFTRPEFRKQGIATRIVDLLSEEALAAGYRHLELHATSDGEPVYIKAGFQLHPEPTYRKLLNQSTP
ncbi:MAG TPA: GNAT family N-acetyltransferase [Bacteroidia bacterium]|nr:GNAT family N-acetyltransferase [Bacteroidia bacterium]